MFLQLQIQISPFNWKPLHSPPATIFAADAVDRAGRNIPTYTGQPQLSTSIRNKSEGQISNRARVLMYGEVYLGFLNWLVCKCLDAHSDNMVAMVTGEQPLLQSEEPGYVFSSVLDVSTWAFPQTSQPGLWGQVSQISSQRSGRVCREKDARALHRITEC